jgi:hypothetical protein
MNNVFLFRKNEYPELYNAKVADRLPERQPSPQNAFTFRDKSYERTQAQAGRDTKGKPRLSARPANRPAIHPAHQANEQTFSKPTLDIKESNDLTELMDLVRQDNERRFQENDNEMKLVARGDIPAPGMSGGSHDRKNKNCYTVIAEEKDGMDCYHVMTGGGKKNISNLENAIAMVKANGYTLFKSKLAQGAKRIRKSRAKSKF